MAKLPGKGVTLKIGSTAIAQIKRIKPPNITAETADITELGDAWRSFKAVVNDAGEVSFDLFFDPDAATLASLRDLFDDQVDSAEAVSSTPQSFVVTFTDATPATATFSGILTALDIGEAVVGGVIEASCTIKISGAITWA